MAAAGAGALTAVGDAADPNLLKVVSMNFGGGSSDGPTTGITAFRKAIGAGVLQALNLPVWLLQEVPWETHKALIKHLNVEMFGRTLNARFTSKRMAVVWDADVFNHIFDYQLYAGDVVLPDVPTRDASQICSTAAELGLHDSALHSILECLCVVRLQHKTTGQELLFASIHVPKRVTDEVKEELIRTLCKVAEGLASEAGVPMVLGGDFNCNIEHLVLVGATIPGHVHSTRRTRYIDWILSFHGDALLDAGVRACPVFPLPDPSLAWKDEYNRRQSAGYNKCEAVFYAFESVGTEGACVSPDDHPHSPWVRGGHSWFAYGCWVNDLKPDDHSRYEDATIFDHDPMIVNIRLPRPA